MRHTGRTDMPLTNAGREQAIVAGRSIADREFALVLTSRLSRARETAELAGLGSVAEVDDDLREWDYGELEGRTTAELVAKQPDWSLWRQGPPGGETLAQVAARADRAIERAAEAGGDVAIFSHGHLLRVLGARWTGQPPEFAERLKLDTAAVCELDLQREVRVLARWNIARPA
jgi:probable phosphoglycerate mutase